MPLFQYTLPPKIIADWIRLRAIENEQSLPTLAELAASNNCHSFESDIPHVSSPVEHQQTLKIMTAKLLNELEQVKSTLAEASERYLSINKKLQTINNESEQSIPYEQDITIINTITYVNSIFTKQQQ